MTRMLEPENGAPSEQLSLTAAIQSFIETRLVSASPDAPIEAPEDGQIWGPIASLMGLSKADRQKRQQEILTAFLPAWIAAGGKPRAIDPKKARAEKRKMTVKKIKNRRAEIAKIVAANQKGGIVVPPAPKQNDNSTT